MTFTTSRALRALPVLLGLGVAGIAVGAGPAASNTKGPVTCEIVTSLSGGMTVLQGVVHAASPLAGSYQFSVKGAGGGGSTNISQGGGFSASPGAPAMLGQVMLGGGRYDADLTVSAAGVTVACSERLGGI